MVTNDTSLYHHPRTGQVVPTEMIVGPELDSSSPSTPDRGTGDRGLYRPSTMYSQWDNLRDVDEDKAFDLWTSPASLMIAA